MFWFNNALFLFQIVVELKFCALVEDHEEFLKDIKGYFRVVVAGVWRVRACGG